MKNLLIILFLLGGTAKAQGSLELYIYASELRGDTRRDVNNQAVTFVGDTLKNGSVGGVFWLCDTCYSTTLWKDDSTDHFVYNASIGVVWVRRKSYPTLRVITDGLGYTPINWLDTIGGTGNGKIMSTYSANVFGATKMNNPSGTTDQYMRGNGSVANFNSALLISTFGFTPLSAEVDGSITNEIELPTQTGQSGKVLSTNGTSPSWVSASAGTVTSIGLSSTDFSVSGSPVTSSGNVTANLNTTGVAAGAYGIVTVDTKGRVTAGKRLEVYSGTTNGSGQYTVTFATAYSVTPNIQANVIGQGTEVQSRILSVSTTGFTIHVFQRVAVLTLALSTATSNVSGASVDVIVTEK